MRCGDRGRAQRSLCAWRAGGRAGACLPCRPGGPHAANVSEGVGHGCEERSSAWLAHGSLKLMVLRPRFHVMGWRTTCILLFHTTEKSMSAHRLARFVDSDSLSNKCVCDFGRRRERALQEDRCLQ